MAQAVAENGTAQAELNERTNVVISMPVGLKIAIDKRAADEQKSSSNLLRMLIAEEFGYELPATVRTRARKYQTEEERQAAAKQRRDERASLFKKLLAKYNAGEIAIDDED